MEYTFIILFFIFLLIFLYIYYNKITKEHFITTWTPYIMDVEYQPGFSNYFYNNGYMYPIF